MPPAASRVRVTSAGWLGTEASGTISNAYATGSVTGERYVGGLVGYIASTGNIKYTYAIGSVSGTSDVGGLVGYKDGAAQ